MFWSNEPQANDWIRRRKVRWGWKVPVVSLSCWSSEDIYHITWNVPSSRDVQDRLIQLEENSEKMMHSRLKEYRRYRLSTMHVEDWRELLLLIRTIDGIKDCYKSVLRAINADQPLNDIFSQVHSFATKKARSVAPRTPRIIILGPTGSGRKTVAAQVSRKYEIPIGRIVASFMRLTTRLPILF